jgi:hypothetical protein
MPSANDGANSDREEPRMFSQRACLAMSIAILFAALACIAPAAAEEPMVKPAAAGAPKRVLFVGNSYLYYGDSLHNHVRRLAVAADAQN